MNIDMYWMKFQERIQFPLAIGSIIGILRSILTILMLFYVFKEVHVVPNKYKGKEGLEKAIKEMKTYYEMNNIKPTSNTIGFNGIYKFIQKGEWKNFVITSWYDLLKFVLGEIHFKINKYIGKEGIERAIRKLKEFKRKNNKMLVLKDLGMNGIENAILRDEWKEYGVSS